MLLAASLTACTSSGGSAPPAPTTESHQPSGPVPAGLERFYGQSLTWADCAPYATSEDARSAFQAKDVQCARLTVPLDYAKPAGDTVTLGLLRHKATDAGARIGSLVVNPGGPGASGMVAAAGLIKPAASTGLDKRFDLVGFDPRGIGASQPAIHCLSDQERDADRADDSETDGSPEGVLKQEAQEKDFAAKCAQRTDDGTGMLANVGTREVAKDLDVLRSVLGDEKLTYLGYSYGTRIGALYAEKYPQNVRAMILDGAIDPNADPIEADLRQAAAFQTAFNDYAADCAKQPDCPLGTDPTKAVDVYKSLVEPLVKNPARTQDPRGLSYSDAIVGTILPLYSPNYWHLLTQGLTQLKGGSGDGMLKLADLYMGRDGSGHYDNSTDVRVAVNCVDKPPITDRNSVIESDRRSREIAPFLSYGQFTGDAPLSTCAFWPVAPTTTPHEISVTGLPPLLVVSTTNDPATPYQAGVDLAKQLGGTLLTFDGTQHTVVFQGNACVDAIAAKYLVDVVVPPPDSRC